MKTAEICVIVWSDVLRKLHAYITVIAYETAGPSFAVGWMEIMRDLRRQK